VSDIRDYWSETGNEKELTAALAQPGVVLQASTSMGHDFTPMTETD